MGYDIGDRDLKRPPQRRLNIIDGYISSYCSILNSPKHLHMIKQANKLASVICDIESDRLLEKEERKKRVTYAEYQRKKKYENKQTRDSEERLKGLDDSEVLVCSVLVSGMDQINNLKLKDLRVLLRYHFGPGILKGIPNKLELVEAVINIF